MKNKIICTLAFIVLVPFFSNAQLETEESNPLLPQQVELGAAIEFQTSKEGTENALPLSIEYGISRKLTVLVEPVAFTNIHPKVGTSTTGLGDLEITLFYQLMSEKKSWISMSLSGEVKLPVANNALIGTGKTDYTPFLIFSKTTGAFFTSANLSYTFLGKPKGVNANNLFNYAIGTIYTLSPKSILFAEVFGNTSAFGGTDVPEGQAKTDIGTRTNTKEISGGETVGSIGYGCYPGKNI